MAKTNDSGAPNNYNDFFYFLPSIFKIEKGIDYLTLSFPIPKIISRYHIDSFVIADEHFFHDFLILNGYKRKRHSKLKKGVYEFKNKYFRAKDNNNIDLFYRPKAQYFPYLLLKIHDPNLEIVHTFQSFFTDHHLTPNLTDLELRFDFYTDNLIKMREFLKHHLLFRYQRSKSFLIKTTYYTNNLRKDGKGMRIYKKDKLKCTRMELRLKRAILKKLNIAFPFNTIDDLNFSRFFSFMDIDAEMLFEHFKWRARNQFEMLKQKRRSYTGLLEQTIYNWMIGLFRNEGGYSAYFMAKIEALKLKSNGVPDYSRFLKPMDDFNAEFNRQVSSQKFL